MNIFIHFRSLTMRAECDFIMRENGHIIAEGLRFYTYDAQIRSEFVIFAHIIVISKRKLL